MGTATTTMADSSEPVTTQSEQTKETAAEDTPVASTSATASIPEPTTGEDGAPVLTKSAKKKLAKKAQAEVRKLQMKARDKERKKAKIAEHRKLVELGLADKSAAPNRRKSNKAMGKLYDARVVIDLDFNEKMTEKELVSMSSQLQHSYAANKRAARALPMLFTSVRDIMHERLESKTDYRKWNCCEWWRTSYEDLWREGDDPRLFTPPRAKETASWARAAKDDVIYLTGDSPNILSEIEEGKTYVIGGIVDRNRYKNLCLDKANEQGLKHAALPIGQYLPEIEGRKILTVNQVFHIMAVWVEKRDWREALHTVMPQRKIGQAVVIDEEAGDAEASPPVSDGAMEENAV